MTPYAEALDQQTTLCALMLSEDGRAACGQMARIAGLAAGGRDLQRGMVQAIRAAVPYYWSPETCNLLEAAAATVPDFRLADEHFPTRGGFCWFARPFAGRAGNSVDAVMWTRYDDDRPGSAFTGPRVMFWEMGRTPQWSPVHPSGSFSWGIGETMAERLALVASNPPVGGFEVSLEEHAASTARSLRRVAAMLAFLEQRVLVSHPESASRPARRRAERAGWEDVPAVQVVYLRRPASASAGGEHEAVEWSCRWLVRGHWRQQWCPAAREHKPIWITPHVKGPEAKPLKMPSATVFAVVR